MTHKPLGLVFAGCVLLAVAGFGTAAYLRWMDNVTTWGAS